MLVSKGRSPSTRERQNQFQGAIVQDAIGAGSMSPLYGDRPALMSTESLGTARAAERRAAMLRTISPTSTVLREQRASPVNLPPPPLPTPPAAPADSSATEPGDGSSRDNDGQPQPEEAEEEQTASELPPGWEDVISRSEPAPEPQLVPSLAPPVVAGDNDGTGNDLFLQPLTEDGLSLEGLDSVSPVSGF